MNVPEIISGVTGKGAWVLEQIRMRREIGMTKEEALADFNQMKRRVEAEGRKPWLEG